MTRWHPPEGKLRREIPASLLTCELASAPAASAELPEPLREQLARLPADGVLALRTEFAPAALCARIEEAGAFACRFGAALPPGAGWSVEVRTAGSPEPLDLRELEAPEPLHRILEAAATLAPGAALLARTPRFPRMLPAQLEQRGLAFEILEEPDESALVHIRRVHIRRTS